MKTANDIVYAHSKEGKPIEEWQRLEENLQNVATMARDFVDTFGSGDWAHKPDCGMTLENASLHFRKCLYRQRRNLSGIFEDMR